MINLNFDINKMIFNIIEKISSIIRYFDFQNNGIDIKTGSPINKLSNTLVFRNETLYDQQLIFSFGLLLDIINKIIYLHIGSLVFSIEIFHCNIDNKDHYELIFIDRNNKYTINTSIIDGFHPYFIIFDSYKTPNINITVNYKDIIEILSDTLTKRINDIINK